MTLAISVGQYSDRGRKPANQDFHGALLPHEPQRGAKGVAVALADGISSSEVAHLASQAAVASFLGDYYCTSEAWSVRTSVERVLRAANAWLLAQSRRGPGRHERERGWVCTFSAMVLKARAAHVFHVGDALVGRVQGGALEPLTQVHRIDPGEGPPLLARALGMQPHLELDYQRIELEEGDTFVLCTDGVHEHVPGPAMVRAIAAHADDLDAAAREIAAQALQAGSADNLTVQVVRVERLPPADAGEFTRAAAALAPPPLLEAGAQLDGLRILRELHASPRSHVYLARDPERIEPVVVKAPALDLQEDAASLERFLIEEWIARRVDSAHVVQARTPSRPRRHLYAVMEHVEGRTLAQWMRDHPRPDLAAVRSLVQQIGLGLRALHRLEMLHQDLRPDNVMVDATGTVKIIDLAAASVPGLAEDGSAAPPPLPGTAQYMAPEYLIGHPATARSDLFSLAVITYQLLTGRLPYGTRVAACRSLAEQKNLRYLCALDLRPDLPAWVDAALRKALQPEPHRRHADVDEFVYSLSHPDTNEVSRRRMPLVERNPLVFWKALSLGLGLGWVALLGTWVLRG